jgi:hypothetical protein
MRTTPVTLAAATTLVAALGAGCESLPERYPSAGLARVGSDLVDAGSIGAELGNATLVREDGRLWIYTWQDAAPLPGRSLLVLEFDADGLLLNRELARAVRPSRNELDRDFPNQQFCTAGATCIEHGVATDESISFEGTAAVTVRGAAKARLRSTQPRSDECVVVVWPGHGWRESRFAVVMSPYGLALRVDDAPKWSDFRWVPDGSFARIVMPAGDHVVSVRDPVWDERASHQETPPEDFTTAWWVSEILLGLPPEKSDLAPSAAPFRCSPGEERYFRVDAAFVEKGGDHWFPIVLRPMEAAEARTLMSGMAQVLPPDD